MFEEIFFVQVVLSMMKTVEMKKFVKDIISEEIDLICIDVVNS